MIDVLESENCFNCFIKESDMHTNDRIAKNTTLTELCSNTTSPAFHESFTFPVDPGTSQLEITLWFV
jgi:hypothetical protein